MTKEEKQAKAETYIGKWAKDLNSHRNYFITKFDEVDEDGDVWVVAQEGRFVMIYDQSTNQWAEIVEQPNQDEFKQGDEVLIELNCAIKYLEAMKKIGSHSGDCTNVLMHLTNIKNVLEPKDKVREKAVELFEKHYKLNPTGK